MPLGNSIASDCTAALAGATMGCVTAEDATGAVWNLGSPNGLAERRRDWTRENGLKNLTRTRLPAPLSCAAAVPLSLLQMSTASATDASGNHLILRETNITDVLKKCCATL